VARQGNQGCRGRRRGRLKDGILVLGLCGVTVLKRSRRVGRHTRSGDVHKIVRILHPLAVDEDIVLNQHRAAGYIIGARFRGILQPRRNGRAELGAHAGAKQESEKQSKGEAHKGIFLEVRRSSGVNPAYQRGVNDAVY